MKFTTAIFASFVAAALADDSGAAGKEICGKMETTKGGEFVVAQNMWGADQDTQAVQCTTGTDAGFKVRWSYHGSDNSVKAYPNIKANIPSGKHVSEIKSISTSVNWKYNTTDGINADVAYDLFTAASKDHDTSSGDYELMIWLARYGKISPIGTQKGIANIAGKDFEFWDGKVQISGQWQHTYSFVAKDTTNDFTGDVMDFFNYCKTKADPPFPADTQYLVNMQFGTEPFSGKDVELIVSDFKASVA